MGEVREDPVAPADTGDKNVSARGLPLAEAFFATGNGVIRKKS